HGWSKSAALAYEFTFALVPLFIISFAFVSAAPGLAPYEGEIQNFLLHHLVPGSADVLSRQLTLFRENAQYISIVGFLALSFTGIALLITVELVFNDIWKVQERRGFASKFVALSSALVWGPLLLGLSYYLTIKFREFAQVETLPSLEFVKTVGKYVAPFLATAAAFTVFYMTFPNTKVKLRPAVTGALIAAFMWEGLKLLFDVYFRQVVYYNVIFGSIGALPVFLGWIYVSWSIFLFGVEASFVIQNFHDITQREAKERRGDAAHPYLAVRCVLAIERAFLRGEAAPNVEQLAERYRVPEYSVRDVLQKLCDRGILVKVEGAAGRYTPARAPDRIEAYEVLEAVGPGRPDLSDFEEDAVKAYFDKVFGTMESQGRAALEGVTLEQLVRRYENEAR
ncbi:MAG: YihY family inner membrane protein, partial [Candidatus Methylomirabilis sp.]|nr:YihY family inner membrane protein [Deltaproteobacteria bacterium]